MDQRQAEMESKRSERSLESSIIWLYDLGRATAELLDRSQNALCARLHHRAHCVIGAGYCPSLATRSRVFPPRGGRKAPRETYQVLCPRLRPAPPPLLPHTMR